MRTGRRKEDGQRASSVKDLLKASYQEKLKAKERQVRSLEEELSRYKRSSNSPGVSKKYNKDTENTSEECRQFEMMKDKLNHTESEFQFLKEEHKQLRDVIQTYESATTKARKSKFLRSSNKSASRPRYNSLCSSMDGGSTTTSSVSSTILSVNVEALQQQYQVFQEENSAHVRAAEVKDHEVATKSKEIIRLRKRITELEEEAQNDHAPKLKTKVNSDSDLAKKNNQRNSQKFAPTLPEHLRDSMKNATEWFSQTIPTSPTRLTLESDDVQATLARLPPALRIKMNQLLASAHDDSIEILVGPMLFDDIPPDVLPDIHHNIIPLLQRQKGITVETFTRSRTKAATDLQLIIEDTARKSKASSLRRSCKDYGVGQGHFFIGTENDEAKPMLHGLRELHATKASYISRPTEGTDSSDLSNSSSRFGSRTRAIVGNMMGGVRDRMTTTLRPRHSHADATCDGCSKRPIVGFKWTCDQCADIELCESCYSQGVHGFESQEVIFDRVEQIVLAKCTKLLKEKELLKLLRYDICKLSLKKFTFCLTWIADIVSGKSTKELKARALEIPRIRPEVRKQFVPLLTRVVSNRSNIDIATEWKLEGVEEGVSLTDREKRRSRRGKNDERETLRIWVKDGFKSKSPFTD